MSSTITTATVSAVTTATTIGQVGSLSLVALILLAVGLFARELIPLSNGPRARRLARGLDIGNAPLLFSFAVIAALNAALTLQAQ